MRLISQDGLYDIPYEKVVVNIDNQDHSQIICWEYGCNEDEVVILGKYSTELVAIKVLQMLREQYKTLKSSSNISMGSIGFLRECTQKEILALLDRAKEHYYFQFPKDEDVEV